MSDRASMNKATSRIVRGAIAAAVGASLLLGGAGTFALWNSSARADASSISSGTLTLTPGAAGSWVDTTNGRNAAIAPSAIVMVPGNSYQFTQAFTIKATGSDLRANLTYDPTSVRGTAALISATTQALTVSSASSTITPSGTPNVFTVAPSATTSTVNVVFTVALPQDATTGQNGSIDLTGLTFTLTQTAIGS